MSSYKVIWTIKELTEVLKERQLNKFDCDFGVSGKRGDGKSTMLYKIFNSFRKQGFKQKKHQVYSQKDVIDLLSNQEFSYCWDDEAINSGYKRDFAKVGQKILIKIITNYRDNFNIYGSALPFFYNLDKALRELMFMHIHIIERGVAIILLPLSDQIHSQDPWDTKNNIKVEEKEYRLMRNNPEHKFRYHKLSTFAGFLYFGPMTKKQEERYKLLKKEKRRRSFEDSNGLGENGDESFINKIYDSLIEKKLSKDGLYQACLIEGRKYSVVCGTLNRMLTDKGVHESLKHFLIDTTVQRKKEDQIKRRKAKASSYYKKYNREKRIANKKEMKEQARLLKESSKDKVIIQE